MRPVVALAPLLVLAACSGSDASGVPAFEMPDAWRAAGVQADTVREGTDLYQLDDAGRAVRYFYRPIDTTITPQALLVVLVHYRPRFQALLSEDGPPPGDSIGGTGDSLVVVALPQSNPFPPGTPDAARFDSLTLDLEHVRAQFRR